MGGVGVWCFSGGLCVRGGREGVGVRQRRRPPPPAAARSEQKRGFGVSGGAAATPAAGRGTRPAPSPLVFALSHAERERGRSRRREQARTIQCSDTQEARRLPPAPPRPQLSTPTTSKVAWFGVWQQQRSSASQSDGRWAGARKQRGWCADGATLTRYAASLSKFEYLQCCFCVFDGAAAIAQLFYENSGKGCSAAKLSLKRTRHCCADRHNSFVRE